jgi:hypothetical protein
VQEVGGSNPLAPTGSKENRLFGRDGFYFENLDHFQNKNSEVSLKNQGISLRSTNPLAPTGSKKTISLGEMVFVLIRMTLPYPLPLAKSPGRGLKV